MNLRRRVDLDRGLWPEALVAGLASLSVAWPLTTLLIDQSWLAPAVVLVAVVAVTGALLRTLDVGPSWVSIGQLLVGALGLAWTYLPDTLWRGLPTFSTASRAADLLQEAGVVLRTYQAPAPTTEGVAFLVVSVLLLTAVAVDTLGVTGGAPAAAGIPLAAAFFVSVSNTGDPMAPVFFLATATAWMVMMAQQGARLVDGWPSRDRRELVGGDDVSRGRTGHRTLARLMGLVALAAALVVAGLVPHLPPTFLAEGLGRNPEGNDLGGSGAQVNFLDTMDPSADLRSQSLDPVLTYTTSASIAEPLKVTATALFADGEWQPPENRPQDEVVVSNTGLGVLPGLPGDVPNTAQNIRVSNYALQPPYLASPAPLREITVEGGSWVYDRRLGVARLDGDVPVEGYRAGYYSFATLDQLPDTVGTEPVDSVAGYGDEVLEVPAEMEPALTALAEEVLAGETRPLEQAILMQQHFRTGGYTYSVDLLEDRPDVPDEPVTQFLANRQGYCLQFATAMTMMARTQGIPARMALGFISGELDETGGSRTVRAADAHTWPELWLDGLGWTRFEPTPPARVTSVPRYSQPQGAVGEEFTQTQQPTIPPDVVPEQDTDGGVDLGQAAREVLVRLGWVVGGLVVLGGLMMLVPLAGRWYRGRDLRRATTPEDEVEAQWLLLTRSLSDLGVPAPEPRSPRAMRAHYAGSTDLDRRAEEALGRVTDTLERVRYAPGGGDTAQRRGDVDHDVETVVEAVRESSPRRVRLRATLLPRTGLTGIREWLRRS